MISLQALQHYLWHSVYYFYLQCFGIRGYSFLYQFVVNEGWAGMVIDEFLCYFNGRERGYRDDASLSCRLCCVGSSLFVSIKVTVTKIQPVFSCLE
jgi:hypothetical protein